MANPVVYAISPLPDFLADHTLAAERGPDQLREALARWINVVASLHVWIDRVSFGIRFVSGGGRIDAYFFALPRAGSAVAETDGGELAGEIEALLRTHRIVTDPSIAHVESADFAERSVLRRAVHATIVQRSVKGLWQQPTRFQSPSAVASDSRLPSRSGPPPGAALAPGGPRSGLPGAPAATSGAMPEVLLPWRGPGGPFLLPLEAMLTQPIRTTVTVHVAPTALSPTEFAWLQRMALSAQSVSDEMLQRVGLGTGTRQVDPAASLAARLYESMLRRLTSTAFLTAVHIGAEFGRHDVLRSVVAALRTQPLEHPIAGADPESAVLPSASDELLLDAEADSRLHAELDITAAITPRSTMPDRLPLLTDAAGAATMLRLPISIRGGVPGMEVRQLAPDFRPGPRREKADADELIVGRLRDGGIAGIRVADLTRHALVTGFTGTGKTVTVLNLLHQLWIDHDVPFLVLESAKAEYRGLIAVQKFRERSPQLRVYTLGNERGVPIRLNPFQLLPGVRVEAHIARLQACIEASIPPIGPSASMIAEALVSVYRQHGWEITDQAPRDGTPRRRFPRFGEFVKTVERLIETRGYRGELRDNLRAALVGRFSPLLVGGKGRMLDVRRCDPDLDTILTTPVILEMNDLSVDDKALVTMFILTLLREYRELHRSDGESLVHLTVVEEAHNVLEDVGSQGGGEGATSADTRHQAVQAFCSMLTEIRSLGEGILIADQSPRKLARDALRNTNLQLAHQLRDADDRDAIASAMIMEDEQRDFLGKLGRGQAAMFCTGLEKATFITIPPYTPRKKDTVGRTEAQLRRDFPGLGFRTDLPDDDVIAYMIALEGRDRRIAPSPLPGCRLCTSRCEERYRDAAFEWIRRVNDAHVSAYVEWYRTISDRTRMRDSGWSAAEAWRANTRICRTTAEALGIGVAMDAAWCVHVHAWDACSRVHAAQPSGAESEQARRAAANAVAVRDSHRTGFVRFTVAGKPVSGG